MATNYFITPVGAIPGFSATIDAANLYSFDKTEYQDLTDKNLNYWGTIITSNLGVVTEWRYRSGITRDADFNRLSTVNTTDINVTSLPLNLDAFGRHRVSDTGNRLDAEYTYDKLPDLIDEVIGGIGTATFQSNTRDVLLATNSSKAEDFSAMYSYPTPYTPGNSQLIEITGVLDNAAIGGGVAQLFLRSKISGTVTEEVYNQADWDAPTLTLDWSTSHIFAMDFQSLKVGTIRYAFNQNGEINQVHAINNDNIRNSGYWQSPSLPCYWRIYNDVTYTYMEIGYGDTDNAIGFRYRVARNASASMVSICCTVKSEGGLDLFSMKGYPQAADMAQTSKTVSTTVIPLLSIRPKALFKTFTNNAIAIPSSISVQIDNPIRLIVYLGATLIGPSWVDVDTNNSTMEYDVSATAFSGGRIIASDYVATSKNVEAAAQAVLGKAVLWARRSSETGILTIAAVRTGTTNAATLAGIKWEEIR